MQIGDTVQLKDGREVRILDEFGSGGQGTVYKVNCEGHEYALKWYRSGVFRDREKDFRQNLENNIARGAPTGAFLWPIAITAQSNGSFGYLMDIRPDGYEELTNFFIGTKKKKQVHFSSFEAICTAAINIIEGFRELHNSGYSYQDINNGNFFINPQNGDVLICDNDNVSPNMVNLGIMGKQRWMAPEIVTGEGTPDKQSDRFSLAVLLFRLLFINHPLEGKYSTPPCMTKEFEKKYYGTNPIFVYDPIDKANRPIPGTDHNLKLFWNIYPDYVKNMFIRAFSKEVMHKQKPRVLEKEWLDVFLRLQAEIGRCPYCGEEMFFTTSETGNQAVCFECHKKVTITRKIAIGNNRLNLFKGMRLNLWNIDSSREDVRTIVAEVIPNPNNPNILGFKNVGKTTWAVTLQDGTTRPVAPEKSFPLRQGYEVRFLADGPIGTIE